MVEDHPINHEMIFEPVLDGGADELFCPQCGRRIRIVWTPEFSKTVIETGDETVIHTAARGLKSLGCAEMFTNPQNDPDPEEVRRLEEWSILLEEMAFDNLWA
jgi:hypothetical protein